VQQECAVKTFDNEDDAFAVSPDAVIVAGPTSTHVTSARKAIAAGAHVLIEKPISHSLQGIEDLIEDADKKNLFIGVGSNMRFYTGLQLLRRNLDKLGGVYFSKATMSYYLPYMRPNVDYRNLYVAKKNLGGGLILDDIHEIDYHIWLFGGVQDVLCRAGKLSDLQMDIEDYAEISLKFSSGVMSQIHMDFLSTSRARSCEIVGPEGVLLWEERDKPPTCSVRFYSNKDKKWLDLFGPATIDRNECHLQQLREFFSVIGGNDKETIADGEEGLHSLKVALAAQKSADTKQVVVP